MFNRFGRISNKEIQLNLLIIYIIYFLSKMDVKKADGIVISMLYSSIHYAK
jgi:hypothetical protein